MRPAGGAARCRAIPGVASAARMVRRVADLGVRCGVVVRGSGVDPRAMRPGRSGRRCWPRWPTSAGWPRRSTSGWARCGPGAASLGRAAAAGAATLTDGGRVRARGRIGGMSDALPAGLLEAVRDRLARARRRLHPAPGRRRRCADRASGRRRHGARGPRGAAPRRGRRRAARAAAAAPGVTDVLVNGPDEVYVDRGAGLERTAVRFRRRGGGAPARAAAGRRRWAPARRRHARTSTSGCPTAPGCHAVLAPLARPGTADLAAGAARRRAFTSTSWPSAAPLTADGAGCWRRIVAARLAFLVSGGTGSGKTTLLAALLVAGRPGAAAGARRGRQRAAPRPSARRRAGGPPGQHRGRRRVVLRDPGPAGAADAARPAGGRRGARRRGGRPAGGAEHRARGRLRHRARQLRRRRPRPDRGAGAGRRAGREAAHSQLASAVEVVVHLGRGRDGRPAAERGRGAVPRAVRAGRMRAAVTFDADGRAVEGPGAARLAERLAERLRDPASCRRRGEAG